MIEDNDPSKVTDALYGAKLLFKRENSDSSSALL